MATKTCPSCGQQVDGLLPVDPGLKLRLKELGIPSDFSEVCNSCFSNLTGQVSTGAQIRARENARQQHRMNMWRNRVNFIKHAKHSMEKKAYSDAAIFYEKYLRILEIIYDVKSGELKPDLLKNRARSKELTVITSVYWDLIRIYDTVAKNTDRLDHAIDQLILFAPQSTINPQLVRDAAHYLGQVKHPEQFRKIERHFGIKRKGLCFIATSAFGSEEDPTVQTLRAFRDQKLRKHPLGRTFISTYNAVSPPIARWMDKNPQVKPIVKKVLEHIATQIKT